MREFLLPVVLLIVAVGVVYLVMDDTATTSLGLPSLRDLVTSNADTETVQADAKETKQAPVKQPRRTAARVPAAPPVAQLTPPARPVQQPSLAETVAPIPAAPKPQAPFDPAAVTAGMRTNRVIELLGKPTLTTATIRDGEFVETYVYKRPDAGDLTRIEFENGIVVTRGR